MMDAKPKEQLSLGQRTLKVRRKERLRHFLPLVGKNLRETRTVRERVGEALRDYVDDTRFEEYLYGGPSPGVDWNNKYVREGSKLYIVRVGGHTLEHNVDNTKPRSRALRGLMELIKEGQEQIVYDEAQKHPTGKRALGAIEGILPLISKNWRETRVVNEERLRHFLPLVGKNLRETRTVRERVRGALHDYVDDETVTMKVDDYFLPNEYLRRGSRVKVVNEYYVTCESSIHGTLWRTYSIDNAVPRNRALGTLAGLIKGGQEQIVYSEAEKHGRRGMLALNQVDINGNIWLFGALHSWNSIY